MQLTSIKPPSVHVQEKLGATLAPLGVEFIDSKDLSAVELRFKDAHDTEVANSAFNDSIDGVKLLFRDSNGNGVRGIVGGYDLVDGIGKLGGVHSYGAFETMPLQAEFVADSEASAATLKALLRPEAPDGTSLSVRVGTPAELAPSGPPAPPTPPPSLVDAEIPGTPAGGTANGFE